MSDVRQVMKNMPIAAHGPVKMDFVEGVSPSMRGVEAVMREVAQSEVPVLLLAERGAGKKATARRVLDVSRHARQPFRVVHCATLEPDKFTGSNGESGLTGSGTVFLEEVAELSAEGQAWLLQALTRENANGGHSQAHSPAPHSPAQGLARFICGRAPGLEAEGRAGNLCEDLYYPISGVCLRLSPLPQRPGEIF